MLTPLPLRSQVQGGGLPQKHGVKKIEGLPLTILQAGYLLAGATWRGA